MIANLDPYISTQTIPTFTVFTPVYNRRSLMQRAFKSLMVQIDRDFEWLIVDDGSSDGFQDDIQSIKAEADFNVIYHYQSNGGKASAINAAYLLARGKYFITLDSDDELTPDSIAIFRKAWDNLPLTLQNKTWCVCALCRNSADGQIVGNRFASKINQATGLYKKMLISQSKGERIGCQKTDIVKKFPFPIFPDTKFVPESLVWKQIDKEYKQYYINQVARIYHTESGDSITISYRSKTIANSASSYYYSCYIVNEYLEMMLYNPLFYTKRLVDVTRSGLGSNRSLNQTIKSIKSPIQKTLVVIFIPVGYYMYRKNKLVR